MSNGWLWDKIGERQEDGVIYLKIASNISNKKRRQLWSIGSLTSVDTRGSGDMNDGFARHGSDKMKFLWL